MRFVVLMLLIPLVGCVSNPWAYNDAPGSGLTAAESAKKPVVYIEPFVSGSAIESKWDGVASEMQKAFTRAILKTGKFEVAGDYSTAQKAPVSFSIETELTDFLHTSDAPESVRRLHWFSKANDAIVALDVSAKNIQTGRVVFSDQVVATISVGDEETDQYGTLKFGSYLFWSTPLGEASRDVIDEAVVRLSTISGSIPGVVTITSYTHGSRDVKLSGSDSLDEGGIYYVGAMDRTSGQFTSVDDDLGRPLRLRVEHRFFGGNTGWLLSEPAEYENITGSTLSKSPLPTRVTSE
ncbi:MAG: hypothetical protein QF718_00625 [Phycisphaerales bacterium]|nr:hypothetical protein [Phycisphaerales bacterium]